MRSTGSLRHSERAGRTTCTGANIERVAEVLCGAASTSDTLRASPCVCLCQRFNVSALIPSRAEKRSADSPLPAHCSTRPDHSEDRYRFRLLMHPVYTTHRMPSPRLPVKGLHVYFHSPYIPHELARHLWGKASEKLGYETPMRPIADVLAEASSEFAARQLRRVLATRRGAHRLPEQIAWPVVDIEEAYGNIESELVKYLVKDSEYEEGAMKLISPELYARIYEGLEGVRTIASSRGFFPNERGTCSCDQCGSTRITRSVSRTPTTDNVVLPETTSAGGSETP